MKKKPTQDQLLQHYARSQPKRFAQIDGFANVPPWSAMGDDSNAGAIFGGETYELMSGAYAVRVLITEGTKAKVALALLDKIKEWIKRDGLPLAESHRLAIKLNNTLTNDPCALCGARTDPDGVDLFLEESMALVCDECGDRHAPELVRVPRTSRGARAVPASSRAPWEEDNRPF